MTDPVGGLSDGERASALHSALAVEELIAANNQSNKTMMNLVERVQDETAARDRKVEALERSHRQVRWVIVLAVILALFLIALGIINAVNLNSTRRSQSQVAQIAANADQTNRTLLDCINARGACGQANAAAQRQVLNQVKLYDLTVIYCARTNPISVDADGTKFVACVKSLYPDGPTLDLKGH